MKIRLLPVLLIAALIGSGCYYDVGHSSGPGDGLVSDGYPGAGNITFAWSFAGMSCAQAGIATVVVDMPGETLDNAGRYPCSTSNFDGITLTNFTPGMYPYSLSAYDPSGSLRYQLSGQILSDGTDQYQQVDLSYASAIPPGGGGNWDAGVVDDGGTGCTGDGGTGYVDAGTDGGGAFDGGPGPDAGSDAGTADGGTTDGGSCGCGTHTDGGVVTYHHDVSWTFPAVPNAPTCGDELAQVVLTVDGQAVAHECGAGLYPSRVSLPTLSAGQHALEIDAIDATGTVWASSQTTIDIPSSADSYQTYQVPWIVGSAAVDWTFFNCDGTQTYATCDQAGVETVAINFQDNLGRWLWADAHGYPVDDDLSCGTTNGAAVLRAVKPGQYTVFVGGYGPRGSNIVYAEYPGQDAYPVTVQSGVFFTTSSPSSDFASVALWEQ